MRGIECLTSVASYFTINISSPNTPDLRDMQAPEILDGLLRRARAALKSVSTEGKSPPLLVKLAPDLADEDLPRSCASLSPTKSTASSCRTRRLPAMDWRMRRSRASRRPLGPAALRTLDPYAGAGFLLTEGKLPLIGVGGISSARTRSPRSKQAPSVQLYTGLVFEGLGLVGRVSGACSRD